MKAEIGFARAWDDERGWAAPTDRLVLVVRAQSLTEATSLQVFAKRAGFPYDEASGEVRIDEPSAPATSQPVDQRSRFGPIGRIAEVVGERIVLCDRSDVENFSPGLEIAVSWKDRCRPNDPDLRPGRVVIRSVDPAIGAVFATAPLRSAIPTATSTDWIYRSRWPSRGRCSSDTLCVLRDYHGGDCVADDGTNLGPSR